MFKNFLIPACALVATCFTSVAALDFSSANWIWIPGAPPGGNYPLDTVSFRRDFTATNGKVPGSANILIAADDAYTLYVNGVLIGSNTNYQQAQRYCVPLVPDCNVFAVLGQNTDPNTPAGLVAAIQIRYTDGFTETINTDQEWHAINGTQPGFQEVTFDDSQWPAAFVEGPFPTTLPWSTPGTINIPPDSVTTSPNIQNANWIWTNELTGPGSNVPAGSRAFRKTITLTNGQLASQANILMATDNQFTLYVNGQVVGSSTNFQVANRYTVDFPPTNTVVIAVYAVNTAGPAGVLAAGKLVTCDCEDDVDFVTDGTWKYSISTPDGFIATNFDDSNWSGAVTEGKFGASPWGTITIPANNSPQSSPLPNAPTAPPATVVT